MLTTRPAILERSVRAGSVSPTGRGIAPSAGANQAPAPLVWASRGRETQADRRADRGWTAATGRSLSASSLSKATVAYHARRLGLPVDERAARRYDWEAIQEAYDSGLTVRGCAARFGFCSATWSSAVRRGAVVPRPQQMPLEQLLVAGRIQTGRGHLKARLITAGLKENRCERCGISEWRGRPLSMQLHHVNGDRFDNRLENLELICANCHCQTENWGGRNGHRRRVSATPSP